MVKIVCILLISGSMAGIQFICLAQAPDLSGFLFLAQSQEPWVTGLRTIHLVISSPSHLKITLVGKLTILSQFRQKSWEPSSCVNTVAAQTTCGVFSSAIVRVIMSLICRNLTRITNVPDHRTQLVSETSLLYPRIGWREMVAVCDWSPLGPPLSLSEERTHSFASQA